MRLRLTNLFLPLAVLTAAVPALAQPVDTALTYQQPPAPIADILDARPTPTVSVGPDKATMALFDRANLPSIEEFAAPVLKLAGTRINPQNNGPANARVAWLTGLSFQAIEGGAPRAVALPEGTRFLFPSWSPDGKAVAFVVDKGDRMALWVADVASATAREVYGAGVSAVNGSGVEWLPDSSGLLVRAVPPGRGPAPDVSRPPSGPVVEENKGRAAPVRTYQDLLSNAGDEALFEHYFTSQLMRVPLAGEPVKVGAPRIFLGTSVSPDGRFILQSAVKKPYSYVVPATLFPTDVFITDLNGTLVHTVADLPLRDDIPSRFDSVAPGPRAPQWRADAPSTLVWVEAQDGGDPRRAADVRDRVYALDAPFSGERRTLVDLKDRYAGISWGKSDAALVYTRTFQTRTETRLLIDPSKPGTARVLLTRNFQDRYNDPGTPVTKTNAAGRNVLQFSRDGRALFLDGAGATRDGEFPFLDRYELATGKTTRLWQSGRSEYETLVEMLDDAGRKLVTRRESRTEPPNFRLRDGNRPIRALTDFKDPAPQFAGVTQELITYKRADGVELSGTLYLPAGYDKTRDGPLPLLMWAYPAEFTDAAVAGQVVDRGNRFVRPGGFSHLFLLTQGYAILNDPTMPIIGKDGAEPNDTYIEQLTASAQAAVDAVVARGVARRDQIAVGGHSYGGVHDGEPAGPHRPVPYRDRAVGGV